MPKFGIGASFEDVRGNVGLTMVQRDNIWHPYYEVTMEDATDLKAAFLANTAERKKVGEEGQRIQATMELIAKQEEETQNELTANRLPDEDKTKKKKFDINEIIRRK
jgi:hypothetical protein